MPYCAYILQPYLQLSEGKRKNNNTHTLDVADATANAWCIGTLLVCATGIFVTTSDPQTLSCRTTVNMLIHPNRVWWTPDIHIGLWSCCRSLRCFCRVFSICQPPSVLVFPMFFGRSSFRVFFFFLSYSHHSHAACGVAFPPYVFVALLS